MPTGKRHGASFKFRVALEAAKGDKTLDELADEYGVHASQISEWQRRLLDEGAGIFGADRGQQPREREALQAKLREQIERLKMELEWLRGKAAP
jgi:transposase-like protein